MADTIDKVVLRSEHGADKEFIPNDGEKLAVKITQVKLRSTVLTPVQVDEAKANITNTIGIVDSILETEKALAIPELQNQLNAVQGVGDIIKGVTKMIPGAPNPMVERLNELEKKIEKLGEKMSANFAEMKSFMTEVKFFMNIMSPTSTLMSCMRDCLKYPRQESVLNFKRAYRQHSTLHLAYKLMTYLEKRATNPLRMAMDAEKGKTKATFKKWMDIFRQLLAQFLFLEAFATGILGIHGSYTLGLLIERATEVLVVIKEWKEEYLKDEQYWEEVKEFMPAFMNTNKAMKNDEKAKQIAAKLETYLTNDAFYVLVSLYGTRFVDCDAHCNFFKEQLVECWNIAGNTAFIYRSREAHKKTEEEFKQLEKEVEAVRNNKLDYSGGIGRGTMHGMIKRDLVDSKLFSTDGFIYLIQAGRELHIMSANCPGHQWGPGWWITANMKQWARVLPFKILVAFY
ncbi:hypothetical protein CAEBREN_21114 [Caenorhabditis brenneri]|uniref:Uncharacterized protein n=1 Tax=Caenorhabditis brenneri TaxID=135651 RepID=G0P047_CAEBE|nr:hypothetical protein CAEBREN_21114 [Caenorhabditis brenneri]